MPLGTMPHAIHWAGGDTKMSSSSGMCAFKKAAFTSTLLIFHRLMAANFVEMKMEDGSAWAVHRCADGSKRWKFPAMHARHFLKSSSVRVHTFNIGNGRWPYAAISDGVAVCTACISENRSCSA